MDSTCGKITGNRVPRALGHPVHCWFRGSNEPTLTLFACSLGWKGTVVLTVVVVGGGGGGGLNLGQQGMGDS